MAPAIPKHKQRLLGLSSRRGLSLVEVAIAMAVFALIAVSLAAVTIRVRRMAERNVYQNTALTMAQGYMEQLRGIPASALVTASTTGGVLEIKNSAGVTLTDEAGGTLQQGEWARETVHLDRSSSGQPIQPFTFRFQPTLVDLTTATGGKARGTEITIVYEVSYAFGSTAQSFRQSLRSVRSHVPTY